MHIRSSSVATLFLLITCALATSAALAVSIDKDLPRKNRDSQLPAALVARADGKAVAALPPTKAEKRGGDWVPRDPSEDRLQLLPPERPDQRSVTAGGVWVSRGPAPTFGAQLIVPPDYEVSGAVGAIAAHPSNADIVYVGAVNGGIWKTTNATAARPAWTPLTDNLASLSIGALAFDPTDATRQTLIAGTGRNSSLRETGDDHVGVYYTTNGGTNWTTFTSVMLGHKLVAVTARGQTLMAASIRGGAPPEGGLFRSTNGGGSFTLISGTGNLPAGGIYDLVGDPGNNSRFYVAVAAATPKVLRSDDGGATWTDVSAGLPTAGSAIANMKLTVGALGVVYVGIVRNTGPANKDALANVLRSATTGTSWTALDVPAIHLGLQGSVHFSFLADPVNQNLLYVGGDRVATTPFSGNLVRGHTTQPSNSQFFQIYGASAGNTQPHADSRAMAFDANGALLEGDDGGIYRRSSPTSAAGVWTSMAGNLAITEVHNIAHDRVANIIMIGTQDNGTHWQQNATDPRWLHVYDGDGGDVAIDDITLGAAGSYRYDSQQNLGNMRLSQYNANNGYVGNTFLWTIPDPPFITPIKLSLGDPKRVLIGGNNAVYESTNALVGGAILTSLGGPGANEAAMVYGGNGNATAAYVAKGSTVYVRQGNAFVATAALPAGAQAVTDLAMDPDDVTRVYAIDSGQVFRSTNSGASWQSVTGNLISIAGQDYRTIEFIPDAFGDLIVLGTRSGVYSAGANSSTWSLFGTNLPNVPVYDLKYLVASRTLIAGTLGRGVWTTTYADPNSAPSFTPAAPLTRQRGSVAGAPVTVGTANDGQTSPGSLSVTQIAGGSATGVIVSGLTNSGGTINATVTADCSSNPGTVRFQVSDSLLLATGDLSVNLTANTAPTLAYANSTVTVGTGTFINPSIALGDNGSISNPALQSVGTYTGGINVNGAGIIQIINAAPIGTHTITVQTIDNCGLTTNASFQLTVSAVPNTAPTYTAGAAITRQQGSAAALAAIGSVSDVQTAAGSLVVTQSGGSASGISTGAIVNSAGAISAPIAAGCTATSGTLGFQVSDGSLTTNGNLQVNVTPNTPPSITYANASIGLGSSGAIVPATGPSDSGSVLAVGLPSQGTYTGGISMNVFSGVITLSNAGPVGTHLINVQVADNCFLTTDVSFLLTVTNAVNTAPTFTAGTSITRQQGSPAGADALIGTVTDTQTPPGNLVVTQINGGSATGVSAGTIINTNGTITAPIAASCTATTGGVRFQASDGSLTGNADLIVNVTPNTAPTLTYANASVGLGAGGTVNPASGPIDNGSILTSVVQSTGTYTGGITVNNITGVVTLTNAAPAGTHTINIQTADNCFVITNASFQLTVQSSNLFANGFE